MTDLAVIACLAFDHRAPPEELQRFKACIVQCPQVVRTMEVCGPFDLIVEGRCADMVEFNAGLDRLRTTLARLVIRIETSFVANVIERSSPCDEAQALWIPCRDGRRRVPLARIDRIVAEGDYMRVHVGDWSGLLHQTLGHLAEQMLGAGFVQLHRSCLVRIAFIERLVHDGRRWTARLADGTAIPVAKSHTHDVLRIMGSESSNGGAGSAMAAPVGETPAAITENDLTLLQ